MENGFKNLEPPPDKKASRVTEQGVADVVVEEVFPKARVAPDLPERYKTTLYADAQPLEGFLLGPKPFLAVVDGGPYHPFGMASPGEPIPDSMPAEAVKRAQEGKLTVSMIVVSEPGLTTGAGLGVGSTFAQLKKAHPKHSAFTLPGLWEEPSCVAKPTKTSAIHFFYKTCDGKAESLIADDEPAIRIVVRRAGKN